MVGKRALFWLAVYISIAAACTYVSWPILKAPSYLYPSGIDTMGHLAKISQVALRWRTLEFGDWFPEWYVGATAVQYYPPLSIWIGAALQVVLNNILVTYKVLVWGCLFLGGLAVARLTRFLGGGLASCILAGVLYSTGGYTMFTVFFDGTLGRAISLPLYPLLLQALIQWCDRPSLGRWLWSCFLVSTMVLAHAMHAYLLFLTAAVYMLVWCFRYKKWAAKVLGLVEIAIVGVALTGFWAVPGATQLENRGIPWSPPEMAGIRSVDISVLLSPDSPRGSTVMFLGSLAGVLILIMKQKDPIRSLALLISLAVTTSLVYGPRNPLYNLLPMNRSLAPLRFINAAFLPAAIGAGFFADVCTDFIWTRFRSVSKSVVAVLVAVILVALSFRANVRLGLPLPRDYAPLQTLVREIPKAGPGMFDSGRVAEELPMIGGESAFFPAQRGFAITAGWNIEGTIHIYTLHNHNIAYYEGYPEYVLRNWYLWNSRSALVDEKYTSIMECMLRDGWTEVDRRNVDGYGAVLLTYPAPPSYLMSLSSDVLVIGRSSFYVAGLFPWVTEGREANPLNYDEDYIDLFKCIVLYDLPPLNTKVLETRIIDWVRKGKTVIVDLSVSDSISSLLGVEHKELDVEGQIRLDVTLEGESVYGSTLAVGLKDGRGATYQGLDRVLLTTPRGDTSEAVCGVRELQFGDVYFVGCHIPRLVAPDQRDQARQVLEPLLAIAQPRKILNPPSFAVEDLIWTSRGVTFDSNLSKTVPVLMSVTYTPRWHVLVDGTKQEVYNHENLVLIVLPPGAHKVQLVYGGTVVTDLGWLLTALTALYICIRGFLVRRTQGILPSLVRRFADGSPHPAHV
jgi:hypothetical protein